MTAQKKPGLYLNNKDLLSEVIKSKQQQKMTDKFARMLMLLTSRYAKKGNFSGYTYNEDMQGYALMMLVRTWDSFDPSKSENPFAFYTQCIKNSFTQFLNQERKQRDIRDSLLVDNGMSPSYSYTESDDQQEGSLADPETTNIDNEETDQNNY